MNAQTFSELTHRQKLEHMAGCKRVTYRRTSLYIDGNFANFYIGRVAGVDVRGAEGLRHTTKEAALNAARQGLVNVKTEATALGIRIS